MTACSLGVLCAAWIAHLNEITKLNAPASISGFLPIHAVASGLRACVFGIVGGADSARRSGVERAELDEGGEEAVLIAVALP